jgi:hypothetical protein
MATVNPRLPELLAHDPETVAAVRQIRDDWADRARGKLAAHRDVGAAKIETSDGTVNAYVDLVDEAAESIEFGHWTTGDEPTWVEGLHIIGGTQQ